MLTLQGNYDLHIRWISFIMKRGKVRIPSHVYSYFKLYGVCFNRLTFFTLNLRFDLFDFSLPCVVFSYFKKVDKFVLGFACIYFSVKKGQDNCFTVILSG